jgi:hypothetical protein
MPTDEGNLRRVLRIMRDHLLQPAVGLWLKDVRRSLKVEGHHGSAALRHRSQTGVRCKDAHPQCQST